MSQTENNHNGKPAYMKIEVRDANFFPQVIEAESTMITSWKSTTNNLVVLVEF